MKSRPRTVASLIRMVLDLDRNSVVVYDKIKGKKTLTVRMSSGFSWAEMIDDVDLPLINKEAQRFLDNGLMKKWYVITWDCSSYDHVKPKKKPKGEGFAFENKFAKNLRDDVQEQEEEGARIIDGERHIGSGAIDGLKSDASSDVWQQESKQTSFMFFKLGLDVLNKITLEARVQHKDPMVFLRYTKIPETMVVESDWVIIPKSVFEKIS